MDICEPHRKHVFHSQECMFIGRLPSNGCPSVVKSALLGMRLPNRRLEVGPHVTIYFRAQFPRILIVLSLPDVTAVCLTHVLFAAGNM
jgi:hypothetical protein